MKSLVAQVESIVVGTPLEGPAHWVWTKYKGLRNPRARQSYQYDRQTSMIMRRVLRRDSNCIDVGAHRGYILKDILAQAPDGRHVAIEPIPKLAAVLRGRFPDVEVLELALSDQSGSATFHLIVDDPGRSGLRRMGGTPADAIVQQLQVRIARLDDEIPDSRSIAFIKVDVEGAQLQVFRGATETIRRNRPYIVFEHGGRAKEGYGTTSDMIFDHLVGTCGLRISLLSAWLAGAASLSKKDFDGHVGFHATSHFCFLAHP